MEINSTFYRSHRPSTYARWREDTPPQFRFAVKLPRAITHQARLVGAMPLTATFRAEVEHLGEKLGPLLVQLPPGLAFDAAVAEPFFAGLRAALRGRLDPGRFVLRYEELDPDIFGGQLRSPGYADVDRIVAIGAVITRV